MGVLRRRFPVFVRPWVAVPLCIAGIALLLFGLGWSWDWSLQTGNVLLMLGVPRAIVDLSAGHLAALVGGGLAIAAAGLLGTQTRTATARQIGRPTPRWRRATFRFFPVTAVFGLFILYWGVVFLFDASVYGDDVPGGYALFLYFDYAGLVQRPVVSLIGLAVTLLGLLSLTRWSFARGHGLSLAPSAPPPAPLPRVIVAPPVGIPRALPRAPMARPRTLSDQHLEKV